MFSLRRVLRFILLCYALYSFAIGIWWIIQAEDGCDTIKTDNIRSEIGTDILLEAKACDETANNYDASGLRRAAIAIYEFIAAGWGDRASFFSIAVVRVLLYAVTNRVWLWGIGWPAVDDNLVIIAIAVEAAML